MGHSLAFSTMAAAFSHGCEVPWFAVIVGDGMPSIWSRLKTFAHRTNGMRAGLPSSRTTIFPASSRFSRIL